MEEIWRDSRLDFCEVNGIASSFYLVLLETHLEHSHTSKIDTVNCYWKKAPP